MKTPLNYAEEAVAFLRAADRTLAEIIAQVGPFQMMLRRGRFQVLVRAIIFQQLAGSAAQAIYDRFVGIFDSRAFPTPEQVASAPDEKLRTVGLSRQKILYLKDLADRIASGTLNLARFSVMEDEEIISELTQVKGIGRWTAEMFLMFNLGRPDVLPVDDLGFRNAVAKAYGMERMPKTSELRSLGEIWRPYRTVAVWYLWQSLKPRSPTPRVGGPAADGASRGRSVVKKLRQPLD
jgi:3-methyladenine DNA glycosylase/8-oxoguanine DNA glycosylase